MVHQQDDQLHIMGVTEGGEREDQKVFQGITTENFWNHGKKIDIQIQDVQITLKKMNLKKSASRHIIIKFPKVKDKNRILREAREIQVFIGAP